MPKITVEKLIDAPLDEVFRTVAHVEEFSKVVPHITKIEFLTDQQTGVGTRFKETRLMNRKEATVELEVTEYEKDDHTRIVSDTAGTVWDTLFTVSREGERTKLLMEMDARAYKLLPKLMNPLICGMIRKAVESDMDAVKAYCEAGNGGAHDGNASA